MRYLTAILGVLAMLVTLSGPVAALTAPPPCHEASMAMMAMGDDAAPCKPTAKMCLEACLAVGSCQSQCGSVVPFVRADVNNVASPLLTMKLHVTESNQPPGTDSPVDGPPPRI